MKTFVRALFVHVRPASAGGGGVETTEPSRVGVWVGVVVVGGGGHRTEPSGGGVGGGGVEVGRTTSRFSDSVRIWKCQFSDHTLFDIESEQHMCCLEQCSIFGALDKHLCMYVLALVSRWCRAGVALPQLQSSPLAQKW